MKECDLNNNTRVCSRHFASGRPWLYRETLVDIPEGLNYVSEQNFKSAAVVCHLFWMLRPTQPHINLDGRHPVAFFFAFLCPFSHLFASFPIHPTEKLPLYLIVLPTGGGFHSPDSCGLQRKIELLSPLYSSQTLP